VPFKSLKEHRCAQVHFQESIAVRGKHASGAKTVLHHPPVFRLIRAQDSSGHEALRGDQFVNHPKKSPRFLISSAYEDLLNGAHSRVVHDPARNLAFFSGEIRDKVRAFFPLPPSAIRIRRINTGHV
jgi:hypothetical protein